MRGLKAATHSGALKGNSRDTPADWPGSDYQAIRVRTRGRASLISTAHRNYMEQKNHPGFNFLLCAVLVAALIVAYHIAGPVAGQ